MTEVGKAKWYHTLLGRALNLTSDVSEAVQAADLAFAHEPIPPAPMAFAFDIFNRTAQGILNRAVLASEKLTAAARRQLEIALAIDDPAEQGRKIVDFIADYRMQLANLLSATQLAALLEGAREVAGQVPTPTPAAGFVPLPPPLPVAPPPEAPERLQFPIIEEAARQLSEKRLVSRDLFDQLDAATRAKAFSVTGVDAQETLGKIRDALVENIEEGVDFQTYKKKVLESVDEGTFLSDAHNEVVFRTNIQAAFSDGQLGVLKHPVIRGGFPYAMVDAIHDDRVRHEHLEVERHGIQGTNIYRVDDPVFRMFRAPWDYNCFVPDTEVQGSFILGLKSWYSGKVIEITTRSGKRLTVTTNHPILTSQGFVPAKSIYQGQDVLCYTGRLKDRVAPGFSPNKDKEDTPAAIEKVFCSLSDFLTDARVPIGPHNLHGDAACGNGYVDVVGPFWKLLLNRYADLSQAAGKLGLSPMNMAKAEPASLSAAHEKVSGFWPSPDCIMSGGQSFSSGFNIGIQSGPLSAFSFGSAANLNANRYKVADKFVSTDHCFAGELLERFSRFVTKDQVVQIRYLEFSGHVYDLQSLGGWIVANGIFCSNCRCGWTPITIRDAAEAGIDEAKQWLDTGQEPTPPAFVQPPPFQPPPGFRRESLPTSVQLSLVPFEGIWEEPLPVPAVASFKVKQRRRGPRGVALANWQPFRGQTGRPAWKDTDTGEIRYQQNKPGTRGQLQKQPGAPAGGRNVDELVSQEFMRLPEEHRTAMKKDPRKFAAWRQKLEQSGLLDQPAEQPAAPSPQAPRQEPAQAPRPDPMQGHPLQGMDREQSLTALQSVTGNQGREKADQWLERLKQTTVPNENDSAEVIRQTVDGWNREHPYQAMPISELAKMLPHLNPMQVQSMVMRMSSQGIVRPFAWTSSLAQLPDEALPYLYPAGDELKFYLHPGPDPKAQYKAQNPAPASPLQPAPVKQSKEQLAKPTGSHKFSDKLESEIEYLLDQQDPDEGLTREDMIQDMMKNMEDKDHWANEFRTELENYGIKVGIYRAITPEEMERTTTTSGRKYDFKRGGTAYVFKSWAPLEKKGGAGMAMEAYGTEPPGKDWTFAGEGKWMKKEPPKPKPPAGPRIGIVGGGPGGLFAAYILSQRLPQASVVVFEASPRLGGKLMTDEFSDGTPFEAGVAELYEYLGPGGKDAMRRLIEEDLSLPTVDMKGGAVILQDKLVRDLDEVGEVFGYETMKRIQRFHNRMVELMPLEVYTHSWQPDNKHPWADCTFRECIDKEIPDDPVACDYVCTAVHSDLATEPWTCNGLNGIKNVLMDNDEYMRLYHVVGGLERIAEGLVDAAGADYRLESRATEIGRNGEHYRIYFHDGKEDYEDFDAIILALPNHWLSQLDWYSDKLRCAIATVLRHYDAPAHYFRVSLLFRRNWWEQYKIPGDFWMMDMCNGCCCYNESYRWRTTRGHVLSFLLGGQDALLQCAGNENDEQIVCRLLDSLPTWMRDDAKSELLEAQVDRFAGSLNAQPGGWPAKDLKEEHVPEPEECPGLFLIGDFLFDSTLNGCLISAGTTCDLCLKYLGARAKKGTPAIRELKPDERL
jgi:hypothetical protein